MTDQSNVGALRLGAISKNGPVALHPVALPIESLRRCSEDDQCTVDAAIEEFETVKKIDKSMVDSLRAMSMEIQAKRTANRDMFFGLHRSDRQSFENTSDDNLKGQNNPRVAAASRFGRAKHKDLHDNPTYKCARREFPAGGGFADCVSHEQCTVWEFKPDSYAMSAAEAQARGYVDDVNRAFPKADSAGKAWEQCWRSDGPTRGEGFWPRGFLYPKCDGRK